MSDHPSPKNTPAKTPQPWDHIKDELKSALTCWEELSQKYDGSLSAEEQKLNEMRQLLKDLKGKINDLSKP